MKENKEIKEENSTKSYIEALEESNTILSKRLEVRQETIASLRNELHRTKCRVANLKSDCKMWKKIAENNNKNINPEEAEKDWNKIQEITSTIPNFWAEVIRLDTDFCQIKVKGTPFAYEVDLKGALCIILDLFADIKPIRVEPKESTATIE